MALQQAVLLRHGLKTACRQGRLPDWLQATMPATRGFNTHLVRIVARPQERDGHSAKPLYASCRHLCKVAEAHSVVQQGLLLTLTPTQPVGSRH